jgi:hypothetical protein
MKRAASISEDTYYRYTLSRQWDEAKPGIVWVGLNSSTADGERDDPTSRRVIDFSQRWGFGTANIVNLFAFRATDPRELTRTKLDPVGPANDSAIAQCLSISSVVVLAWGTHPFAVRSGRVRAVWDLVAKYPIAKVCLGVTQNGSPRHPLYVASDTKVKHWSIKQ